MKLKTIPKWSENDKKFLKKYYPIIEKLVAEFLKHREKYIEWYNQEYSFEKYYSEIEEAEENFYHNIDEDFADLTEEMKEKILGYL